MPTFTSLLHEFVANAHGNLVRVRELLDAHPELLDARFLDWDETAIEAAAHTGSRDIAELLLARGARPTHGTLAMLGRAEELRNLLAAQQDLVDTPGAHGISLLFHAALSGDAQVLEVVWAAGARDGLNHAVHGALHANSAPVLAWLLAHGAGVTTPDWQGKTPLEVAEDRSRTELVELLRQASCAVG